LGGVLLSFFALPRGFTTDRFMRCAESLARVSFMQGGNTDDSDETAVPGSVMIRQRLASLDGNAHELADPKALAKRFEVLREIAEILVEEIEVFSQMEAVAKLQSFEMNDAIDLREEIRRLETYLIRSALKRTGGHQTKAARLLGINLTTLNQKLKRLGISANMRDHSV